MNIYIRLIIAFLITPIWLSAQSSKIEFTIEDYPDGEIYIAYYYGKYQYIQDTLYANPGTSTFVLEQDSLLKKGMYILATKNKMWYEFIIDDDQEFKMTTHIDDMVLNMKVEGSQENNWFFTFLQDQYDMRNELDSMKKKRTNVADANELSKLERKIADLDLKIKNYQSDFIDGHPDAFLTSVFKGSKEPVVPDSIDQSEGSNDAYQYFIHHFWDEFDLSDGRLVYTPLMFKKMERFFSKILIQDPDTLIVWSDWFIARTKADKEMYKFAIWYLTNTMQTSNIMGHDAVFVHLVDKYYKTGEAYWATPSVIKSISESSDQLKRILIGNKSPDLVMTDTAGAFVTLHAIEADYTILYFWDTDCGHCLTETPKLKEIYDQVHSQGVEIFAVQIEQDEINWKKHIREKNLNWINAYDSKNWNNVKNTFAISATPLVYVLDKDKKIIYKKIAVVQLWDILEREGLKLEKPQQQETDEAAH